MNTLILFLTHIRPLEYQQTLKKMFNKSLLGIILPTT